MVGFVDNSHIDRPLNPNTPNQLTKFSKQQFSEYFENRSITHSAE
mgnify:CR=1 FL=1